MCEQLHMPLIRMSKRKPPNHDGGFVQNVVKKSLRLFRIFFSSYTEEGASGDWTITNPDQQTSSKLQQNARLEAER